MRRVDLLVKEVLRMTENEDAQEADSGITKSEVVQYLNEAQDRIQSIISNADKKAFAKEGFISIVADQEAYDLPSDIALGARIITIENKIGTGSNDYLLINENTITDRRTAQASFGSVFPRFYYIRRADQILLNPIPSSAETNGLRITYEQRLPDLDIRRGKIESRTITATSLTDFTIYLSSSGLEKDDINSTDGLAILSSVDYVSIVDRDGATLMDKIPIDKYDSATGKVTVSSGFLFESGQTAPVDAYVVAGKTATTHSQLEDVAERFLINYAVMEILRRDTALELHDRQFLKVKSLEQDIMKSYRKAVRTLKRPAINRNWRSGFRGNK
jgi:hypothetical protein